MKERESYSPDDLEDPEDHWVDITCLDDAYEIHYNTFTDRYRHRGPCATVMVSAEAADVLSISRPEDPDDRLKWIPGLPEGHFLSKK
ncbi:MAG: hypothetical protein AB7L09_21465 [Nitrospira sp.]